jgi:hypothetical protein
MGTESKSIKSSPAEWPLKNIKTNPQLITHILGELGSLPGGEKNKEVERITLEYLTQRFNLVEKTDENDTAQLKRMGKFYDFAVDYINKGKVYLLEKIYQASKGDYESLGDELNSVFQDIYASFKEKGKEVEREFRGKKVEELRRATGKEVKKASGSSQ